jgi:hypothetical protein
MQIYQTQGEAAYITAVTEATQKAIAQVPDAEWRRLWDNFGIIANGNVTVNFANGRASVVGSSIAGFDEATRAMRQ